MRRTGLWALLILLVLPLVNSIPSPVGFESNVSTDPADWSAQGGFYFYGGNTLSSNWSWQGASNPVVSNTVAGLNLSPATGTWTSALSLNFPFQRGQCLSFNFTALGLISLGALVQFQEALSANGSSQVNGNQEEAGCGIEDVGGQQLEYRAGWNDGLDYRVNNGKARNSTVYRCTICLSQSTVGGLNNWTFYNNSVANPRGAANFGLNTTFNWLSINMFNNNGAGPTPYFILHWMGIFNETLGAPSVAAPAIVIINNTLPIITLDYPSNGSTLDNFTYPLIINGSVYVQNGSIQNTTINNTNFKNYGNQTNFSFQVNGSVNQQRYDLLLNATSQYGNTSIYILSITIDFNAPTITGSTLNLNNSIFYIGRNITFQFNYTDNIKIFHINITSETYSFELTNINQSTFIYNGSINGSTFGLGRHSINTTYCDAHTKNEIGQWENTKDFGKKSLEFEFQKGEFSIRPKDPSLIENFDTEKKKDRYIFKYTKKASKKSNIQTFIVSSDKKIDIIGNDNGYYGWLIIKDLNKWIDFNLADGTIPKYKITRIDNFNVEVEMDGIYSDSFEFQSAGDLNCNSRAYYYYLFNYTAVFNTPVTESIIETIKLVIDTGGIRFSGNGTLNYSNVLYNTTNTTSNNQVNLTINLAIPQPVSNLSNATFFWNFNLNSSSFTTINYTQLVNRVRLLVCSLDEEMKVLNISIFDENSPSRYLEGDIDSVFTTWTNDSGNTLNFTFSLRSETNYSICLAPNTSINTDTYFQYNTSGGFKQRWFLTNARLNSNTSLLYLYNFASTSGISTLKGTLKDDTYAFYPLVITKLQRFYAGENVWRTVQMDKSDDFGLVLFNIIETNTDYRMIFEQDATELSRTNPSKFLCTSGLCDLTFIVNVLSVNSVASPKFVTGFDNRSKIYQLNFTDTTGLTSSARLKVTKEDRGQIITICDQTLTASDGTINCNVSGYTGTLQARVYSSASPETAKLTEYITIQIGKLFQRTNTYITNNELTFWGTAISVTLTLGGAIFGGPIGALIMYVVSLIGIYAIGIINFVTVTFITLMASLAVIVSILINMGKNG